MHLADQTARLVELKWHSDTPVSALFEVLEYGLAYLLARIRRLEFDLGGQALMQDRVTEVRLEVVGPRAFYAVGHNPQLFKAIDKALRQLVAERSDEISMSLDALAFPPWFDRVPFESGKEVKDKCATSVFTDEGRRVCEAFEQLTSAPSSRSPRFLDGVPGTHIENLLDGAAGNEIGSGKFDHPDSSAALAVNTFGFFLHRPAELPALPGLEDAGWPARSLRLEEEVRFPWRGGRHPVLDFVLTTPEAVVGIECKRLEPFRGSPKAVFSKTYWRPVWGNRMEGYQQVRDLLRNEPSRFRSLDAAQLVKHALALRSRVQGDWHRRPRAILLYVYAEPDAWPSSGRRIDDADKVRHECEIDQFAELVADDEVAFVACSYRRLLDAWSHDPKGVIREHARAVLQRYSP